MATIDNDFALDSYIIFIHIDTYLTIIRSMDHTFIHNNINNDTLHSFISSESQYYIHFSFACSNNINFSSSQYTYKHNRDQIISAGTAFPDTCMQS